MRRKKKHHQEDLRVVLRKAKVSEHAEDAASTSSDSDMIIMSEEEMPVDPDSDAMNVEEPPKKCKVGCLNGRAKPPACDFTLPTSIQFKNVGRDHVNEECQRLGIYYKRWVPLNPEQTSHPSVRDFNDDTVTPDEQNIPGWCIMFPRNTYLKNENLGHHHYLSRHHKSLLVVQDFKLFSCICSEVRSHGSDNSAHNKHTTAICAITLSRWLTSSVPTTLVNIQKLIRPA